MEGLRKTLEHDAIGKNRSVLCAFLLSHDLLQLTGAHLIASRSNSSGEGIAQFAAEWIRTVFVVAHRAAAAEPYD